jgi:hypothetical protein
LQFSYRLLYFDLLPPSPFLREANKVAFSFWICILILSFGWSIDFLAIDPMRGITTDAIIVGSFLAEGWYLSLLVTSTWRLGKYRKSAVQVPLEIYQFLYPWIGILVINTTLLAFALFDRATENPKIGQFLYKVLSAELVPLVAFEVPIIKKWLPQFQPMRFVRVFQKCLAILLGREWGVGTDEHARYVVEFQHEFDKYLEVQDRKVSYSDLMNAQYNNSQTLAVFQKTLSCLYETSDYIGKNVGEHFRNRNWTMLDIGGGEGIFTMGLLSLCPTPPRLLTVLDPSEANVLEYRARISSRFKETNIDAYAKGVEEVVDDLPNVNFLLASHSLYAVLDQNKRRADTIIHRLARQTSDGFAAFIMASKDSYLYTIKRTVLGHLHRVDRSSYGEDLADMLGAGITPTQESLDSVVDVSGLLDDYEGLLAWLSYFCRVDAEEIRPYYDICQAVVRDTAIEIKCLPREERSRLENNGTMNRMSLTNLSRIIYHKELVITVPSERQIPRV